MENTVQIIVDHLSSGINGIITALQFGPMLGALATRISISPSASPVESAAC
jgi:hypothetical protein